MPFQKVEFEFPEGDLEEKKGLEIEPSSALEVDIGGKKAKAAEKAAKEPAEDDVELEIIDDTPKADRGRKPSDPPEEVTDEELEAYSEKVQQRIKHFSKGYHDERRAKEAALRERQELERLAQKLVEENKALKGDMSKSQQALLEQAKRVVTSEYETAKKAYRDAYESGDPDAVLEAQEALAAVRSKSDKINNFKLPPLQEDETPVQMEPEPARASVVDTKAQKWQEANPWFNQDVEMTSYAIGLHNKLVNDGVDPTSDEYYERIDARMRKLFPENFEGDEKVTKQRSNVVAPATRSTAPKKIRLTQTQLTLAKRLGLSPEQYAKQVALDMRNGNG